MKMAWTEKGVGDKEVEEDESRFIFKLTGLVEVWWVSMEIKDDLRHSVNSVLVGKFLYNMQFCLAIELMISLMVKYNKNFFSWSSCYTSSINILIFKLSFEKLFLC